MSNKPSHLATLVSGVVNEVNPKTFQKGPESTGNHVGSASEPVQTLSLQYCC